MREDTVSDDERSAADVAAVTEQNTAPTRARATRGKRVVNAAPIDEDQTDESELRSKSSAVAPKKRTTRAKQTEAAPANSADDENEAPARVAPVKTQRRAPAGAVRKTAQAGKKVSHDEDGSESAAAAPVVGGGRTLRARR